MRSEGDAGVGPLREVRIVGKAGSVECGALVRVELSIRSGIVEKARYQAYGCPATIAAAREVTKLTEGTTFLEAAALSEETVAGAVGPEADRRPSVALALDALHTALGKAALSSVDLTPGGHHLGEEGVLVGMSGGVDSAVAALMLREQGHRVVGLTLRLWSDPGAVDERSCCSSETVARARRTAHSLGLPHLTVDAGDVFYERVVGYFVDEYGRGRTPNPCAKCNARVRIGLMLDLAGRLGFSQIATGHYARMLGCPATIARGVDRTKDQSYVLAEVPPELLRQVLFPLGEMTKSEVREVASAAGLEGHGAPESQEICFVADDDHKRFLRERLGERPGDIVDEAGRVLGHHAGTYNYTVGQRKGLGIAAPEPLYVLALDAERARVVVGQAADCAVGAVLVDGVVWHSRGNSGSGTVQLRSAGPAVPAHLPKEVEVEPSGPSGNRVSIVLEAPAFGVAAGQTAVMYDGEVVRLAGTIVTTGGWTEEGEDPMDTA